MEENDDSFFKPIADAPRFSDALGQNTQTITIGGVKPDGSDATNDLSYLFLEAYVVST